MRNKSHCLLNNARCLPAYAYCLPNNGLCKRSNARCLPNDGGCLTRFAGCGGEGVKGLPAIACGERCGAMGVTAQGDPFRAGAFINCFREADAFGGGLLAGRVSGSQTLKPAGQPNL